ncbi:hypothetical protein [uncultured Methylophaga sp.]|uniref:hypothetical protein n=1 Tax=uncultured Methylophaga sp. TaxID=285271 RepID=UPI00260B9A85|nr:hypothetical protein [uncultured Methylophaga sp.]
MKMRLFFSVLAIWLLGSGSLVANEANAPAKILQQDQGRSFGVMVGDKIHHRFLVAVDDPYTIIQSSLPQPGDLTYWLELRDISVTSREADDRTLYLIDLSYQTFYAPLDVRALEIPAIPLDFSAGEQRTQLSLPKWEFTMSPIKEITPRGVGHDNQVEAFMKPAIAPRQFSLNELNQQTSLLAVASIMILLLLLWLQGMLPKLGLSPFTRAAREIRRIKRSKAKGDDYLASIQAVHKAINKRADGTVFASQLEQFIEQFPQFAGLKPELARFFELSRDAFFMDKRPGDSVISDCLNLCRQLAAADKVSAVK